MDLKWQQLITGLIDGELSHKEKARAEKLLSTSPEARLLYAKLQQDAKRIQQLPTVNAPTNLSELILTAIRENKAPTSRSWPSFSWYYGAAAAVLLALSIGSLWIYWTLQPKAEPIRLNPHVVQSQPAGIPKLANNSHVNEPKSAPASWVDLTAAISPYWRLSQQTVLGVQSAIDAIQAVDTPMEDALGQLWFDWVDTSIAMAQLYRDQGTPHLLTSPLGTQTNPFKSVTFKLPAFIEVRGIDLKQSADVIRQGGLFHLDVACSDATKTLGHLMNAGGLHGIRFHVDQDVPSPGEPPLPPNSRIRRPQSFIVYVENIHPATLYRWLYALEDEDRRAVSRRHMEQQLKSILLYPVEANQNKLWADSLGVAPVSLSVSPAPADTKPSLPIPAVVMGMLANRSQKPASKEIRQLLENRTGPVRGRISLIVTIHPQKNADTNGPPRGTFPTRPR